MTTTHWIVLPILVACALGSQVVTRGAIAGLDDRQRAGVLQILAGAWRNWWIGLLLVGATLLSRGLFPSAAWHSLALTLAMLVFFVAVQDSLARKLTALGLPGAFVRRMWAGWGLLDLGALAFFGANTYLAFSGG
jgi:hypothetical protein